MNQKGIYSALMATVAIILIGAIIISASYRAESIGKKDFSEKILELKREWNQARYLLDKALSDALADSVDNTCNFSLNQPKIQDYFDNVINKAGQCNYSITDSSLNGKKVTVDLEISCTKSPSNEFKIREFKKSVAFEKKVDSQSSGGICTVTVTDEQSNVVEVSKTF